MRHDLVQRNSRVLMHVCVHDVCVGRCRVAVATVMMDELCGRNVCVSVVGITLTVSTSSRVTQQSR